MKTALIIAWAALAMGILWWPRPPSFDQRFPHLPPSMSLQVYDAARKAAERPAACVYRYRPHQAAAKTCAIG